MTILFLAPMLVTAQVGGDRDVSQRQRDLEAYKQQRQAAFENFKDSINREFAKMLEQKWTDFEVFVGIEKEAKPKPQQIPVAPQDTATRESQSLPYNEIVPAQGNEHHEKEIVPSVRQDDQQNTSSVQSVTIDFYNQQLDFSLPTAYRGLRLDGLSERAIAKFWTALADNGYGFYVGQCQDKITQLSLNDWATYELAVNIATEVFQNHHAEQTVFTVFLLNQLGLDARIGRTNTQLLMLIPTRTRIYGRKYIDCDNISYYLFSLYPLEQQNLTSLTTYLVPFPADIQPLDMNIYHPIRFVSNPSNVIYQTSYWGKIVPFQVNQNAIRFYSHYPQVDMAVYANAQMSEELLDWAKRQIKPTLDEYSDYEAVSMLLYYLQTEFEYATDADQFGYEKPFFCEENFFYQKNDCEDRAILLSYLVRNLTDRKIILLDYPNHIAAAVNFSENDLTGDYYLVDGEKYYVCDPTYMGASIGESMPEYKEVRADIIKLK